MPMNPMSPKTLPPVAAFRLLADLNDYMSLSPKERKEILENYVAADEQRQTMLDAMATSEAAAAFDRKTAAEEKEFAIQTTFSTVREAEESAKLIVDTAVVQAATVTETARLRLIEARDTAEQLAQEGRDSYQTLTVRQEAFAEREASAFDEREADLAKREETLKRDQKRVGQVEVEAKKAKETYGALVEGFNALQRSVPK